MLNFEEYIKRPIPIKACQLTNDVWNEIYENVDHEIKINGFTLKAGFINELYFLGEVNGENMVDDTEKKVFYVNTLEDVNKVILHKANIDDFLIIGVEGEIYACNEDIFKKTYSLLQDYSTDTDIYQDACKLADLSKELILGGDHLDCEDCYKSLKTQALKDYVDEKWQEY